MPPENELAAAIGPARVICVQVTESEGENEREIDFGSEIENDPGGDRPHDVEVSWPTMWTAGGEGEEEKVGKKRNVHAID